ncbi:hypothetical protein ACFPL7_20580 [Dongia soli]|uniref:Uncharacterized protein n=1 Tax=Dongia soli TaxID=600628 RepID=A0ABU5E8W2_9PROT|nr:hypothetical protein [Dongia soli]MDY0881988.1 hypothetical protein [Dongia soli]
MHSINAGTRRPIFRGRDLTAGPVIGYGSRPISRRRSRARKKRYVTVFAVLLVGALSVGLGYSVLSATKPVIERQQ